MGHGSVGIRVARIIRRLASHHGRALAICRAIWKMPLRAPDPETQRGRRVDDLNGAGHHHAVTEAEVVVHADSREGEVERARLAGLAAHEAGVTNAVVSPTLPSVAPWGSPLSG